MKDYIKKQILSSIEIKTKLLNSANLLQIQKITQVLIKALKNQHKILICGNGGSAADAQHLATELVGKFYLERPALPAIALTCNTSSLTAIANDYDFDQIFSRQIEALAEKDDVLICISTSGNSINILQALRTAKIKKIHTVGLTGGGGGKMKNACEFLISVPSKDTPRIQEAHILIGHILCDLIEKQFYGKK